MKREEIKTIFADATAEQLEAVMKLNNADVEKSKGKLTVLETELEEKKTAFENLNTELEQLKMSSASAEDYKNKFEKLQKEIAEKEKAAKEEKEKAEREANILNRYNAAAIGKDGKPLEWSHEAIKADYLRKFAEALEDEKNTGKSDTDIFDALVKDDGAAFKVPQAQNVFGGANNFTGGGFDDEKINAIMGIK